MKSSPLRHLLAVAWQDHACADMCVYRQARRGYLQAYCSSCVCKYILCVFPMLGLWDLLGGSRSFSESRCDLALSSAPILATRARSLCCKLLPGRACVSSGFARRRPRWRSGSNRGFTLQRAFMLHPSSVRVSRALHSGSSQREAKRWCECRCARQLHTKAAKQAFEATSVFTSLT